VSLFLAEFPLPLEAARENLFRAIADATDTARGEVVEVQVGTDAGRVFVIAEHATREPLEVAYRSAGLTLHAIAEVRLVGPSLDEVKAARGDAGFIVEWDLPEGLTLERYLERKREKAPAYAQVPETTFLRTYVCVDMTKCLCFYRAPDEEAVLRARAAVETPVDRLSRIEEAPRHVPV
jgi:hypothetical protein